jgi:hypothetical protein
MSYPTKPGDTYTARVIGTYPELPEFPFDTKENDPQFYFEKDFDSEGNQTMRFGGPKGEVVVTLRDGVFTHTRPDGTVLRRAEWNAKNSSWDVKTQASTLATYDSYIHRDGVTCILLEDGTWFIPYDAGGEGVTCEREHGPSQRDDRALGWDRAHTMLCHDVYPKCQHRNPWMRTRATT